MVGTVLLSLSFIRRLIVRAKRTVLASVPRVGTSPSHDSMQLPSPSVRGTLAQPRAATSDSCFVIILLTPRDYVILGYSLNPAASQLVLSLGRLLPCWLVLDKQTCRSSRLFVT